MSIHYRPLTIFFPLNHYVTSLWARFHIAISPLILYKYSTPWARARQHLPRPRTQVAEYVPFESMLDEVEKNSSILRECVSEAFIKRSLAEPKKQPRRRATSGAHKPVIKNLGYDEDETSDLVEFAEVWLIKHYIEQRLRRSSSTSPRKYSSLSRTNSKVSSTPPFKTPQN